MVLKRDWNGAKIAIFDSKSQKSPSSLGLCPSVTRLICNGLFSTGPKWDNFCAKTFTFGSSPLSLSKTLVALLVAFHSRRQIFQAIIRGRIRNELINVTGLIFLFFQRWIQNCSFKISVFMCKSSVFFIVPPHFRLWPPHFVWFGYGTAGSVWFSRSYSIYRNQGLQI